MRSRFVLIAGCVVIALWAIGMAVFLVHDAAEDPLRLEISEPGLPGRIDTTTTAIVEAIVMIVILAVLVVLAIKRARTRTKEHPERRMSMLDEIKERLRRDYPKYFDRKDERE